MKSIQKAQKGKNEVVHSEDGFMQRRFPARLEGVVKNVGIKKQKKPKSK